MSFTQRWFIATLYEEMSCIGNQLSNIFVLIAMTMDDLSDTKLHGNCFQG